MRRIVLIPLLLCTVGWASQKKSLDELKSSAERAHGGEQARLYAEIAETLVGVADQQFTQGDSSHAHATVQEILQYAEKARDGAISSHDQRKEVEIRLRNTQRHLENMKQTLAQIDRPPVDEAEKKLANFRQDLLDSMFAPKHKKESQ